MYIVMEKGFPGHLPARQGALPDFGNQEREKQRGLAWPLPFRRITFVMKILITSDTYAPTVNGVVTSILNLREQLERLGHEVRVLALSPDFTSKVENGVYYIRSFSLNIYPGVRAANPRTHCFMEEILAWKPDIIHTQCEFFTMHFAQKIAKELQIPIVHTYHTMYDHYVDYLIPGRRDKTAIVCRVLHRVLKNLDTIIAPTNKAKLSLEGYRIPSPIVVIPTGIDLSRFEQTLSEEERSSLTERLRLPEGKKILVTVGRLGKEKNVDELLRYLARLPRQDWAFLIVGDGPYKEELEQLTAELGLEDRVIFAGMVPAQDTWKYYKLGDIFISGSISETQGLTYVEALASGTPLVCRKDSCLEDVLEDGYNGFFYTQEEEFSKGISRILDEGRQEEFCGHAIESSHKFSKENFGLAVEKLYQDLVKTHFIGG